MTELALVMPMAGRGSRFERQGFTLPKPLIRLHGRPFFAWAIDSLKAKVPLGEIVCVVLREHVERYRIDREIVARYPTAIVAAVDEVTSGAAETAALGIDRLGQDRPFAVNDCDHAFDASGLTGLIDLMGPDGAQAGLLGFRATSPAYSYVRFDPAGRVVGTVEKQVAGPFAIAGCYLFSSPSVFQENVRRYRDVCPYPELYLSGIYNSVIEAGGTVAFQALRRHIAFGTPEEMERVGAADLEAVASAAPEAR